MKRGFYVLIVLWLLLTYKVPAFGNGSNHQCGESGFSTEVIQSEMTDNGCIRYTLEVSHNNRCSHALSHYTVSVSCGKIYDVSNSENWKIEYGYDKKTKLTGFKVDDIPNFGDTDLERFTVSFTVCQEGNTACATKEGCCYPIVAYKAGTCVYYDKLDGACPVPPDDDPPATTLKASIEKQDITCFGAGNGSMSVKVEEGKEPYTYLWSTGATTAEINGIAAGDYTVTIKDSNGAGVELTETMTEPSSLTVSGELSHEACGNGGGAVDITVTGGAAPYSFNWNSGLATTEDLSSLHAGTYSVVVTDNTGCTVESAFVIDNQAQLSITGTTTMPACGQANGDVDITVSGGTEPYTYLWSNGSTTQDIQGIGPGNYKVIVNDANGCSAEYLLNVKENNSLKLTYMVTQTSCLDDGSGAIDLIVAGGTGPYTYAWTNNETTEDINGLTEGSYTVTVTDAAGCTAQAKIFVSRKTFQVNSNVTQPSCDGSVGGSISLFPINTTETYTYLWSTGATTSSISGLEPGIYKVTVTDGSGCSRALTYVISDPTGITASSTVSNDQCNAEGAYSIDLEVSGGSAPYSYQWSNGAASEDIEGVATGTYSVTITDLNGCSATHEVQVAGDPPAWSCLIDTPT
ncbi:MAG TPA: SprB repeat-containing protein, partial [Cyclobacteriaceae bacterium]